MLHLETAPACELRLAGYGCGLSFSWQGGAVNSERLPIVAIVFSQFAAYHVDRCEAAAMRLAGQYCIRAVEVASRSETYAWDESGGVAGAEKLVLFPGQSFEGIGWLTRLRAEWRALRDCRAVLMGLPYSLPDAIVLSWLLRLRGTRVVVMTESKHDDRPRKGWQEAAKATLLRAYHAALVGGRRQADYMAMLGFRRRPVVPGYDAVSIARIRGEASGAANPAWADRPFVFVGRFVDKKNLPGLLRGYAAYVGQSGSISSRRLVLLGDGPLRGDLEALAFELGVADLVDWPGFLGAEAVSRQLAASLALCLVSHEEQWGLVVNEALALGLPVIVSRAVGARDALVRDGENGYVLGADDAAGIARAMTALAGNRSEYERMAANSVERATLGDVERFADACEVLLASPSAETLARVTAFRAALAAP